MSAILENDSANRSHFYKQVFSAYESFLVIASSVLIVFVRPFSDLLISTSTYTEYADAYRYTPILIIYLIRVVDTKLYVPFYIDHTRFVLNLILMFAMTFVTIQTPPAWHLIDGVLLIFTVLYNFRDLVSTVRRVLKRG